MSELPPPSAHVTFTSIISDETPNATPIRIINNMFHTENIKKICSYLHNLIMINFFSFSQMILNSHWYHCLIYILIDLILF